MNVKVSKNLIKLLEEKEAAERAAGKPSSHPMERLARLADDPLLPKSLLVEILLGMCRFRMPLLSSSRSEVAGEVTHKQTSVTSVDVVAALANCDPAIRRKSLTSAGILQLGEANDN